MSRLRADSPVSDVVRLAWAEPPTPDAVEAAILALDSASGARPRRAEAAVTADVPRAVRYVLHRHGFRLEGVARQARLTASGPVDVLHYARLDDDPVEPRARFTSVMNSVTPRKRLIAHALVTDAGGRVLLCQTSFKPDWELPGGIVEPFESPGEAVTREMVEEMGWAPAVGRVLVVDWLRPYLGWEDALELVFDAEPVTAEQTAQLVPDGQEILALHWVDAEGLDAVMTPFGAARARSALRARAERVALYTEAGESADNAEAD